jgi:hypothetical protein
LESIPENDGSGYRVKLILKRDEKQVDLDFKGVVNSCVPLPDFGTVVELLSGADGDVFAIVDHHGMRLEAMISTGLLLEFVLCTLDFLESSPSTFFLSANGGLRSSVQ